MATYLDRIVAAHRVAAADDHRPLGPLRAAALAAPPPRPFAAALAAAGPLAVIAEIKRRSPSRGDLAPDLVPAELAARYEAGGATALSVLTDAEFFAGSPSDLAEARAACLLPVLRKDFTVGPRDVLDARAMGADAVLLIVAALEDAELAALLALAGEVGLDALVEVHDEAEVERALAAGATLVGVNQRDLTTFAVDRARAGALAPRLAGVEVRVAESGITGPDDVGALAQAGYHAVLVGEWLVTSDDPGSALGLLVGARA
ncbi:MAG: indole-3-glycerol phosphate synthase TrpC [Actinomycetota bacterium]|nr:indole-3-glycerol phosphate synthase TrpC [Actinomycetota bacterium]